MITSLKIEMKPFLPSDYSALFKIPCYGTSYNAMSYKCKIFMQINGHETNGPKWCFKFYIRIFWGLGSTRCGRLWKLILFCFMGEESLTHRRVFTGSKILILANSKDLLNGFGPGRVRIPRGSAQDLVCWRPVPEDGLGSFVQLLP